MPTKPNHFYVPAGRFLEIFIGLFALLAGAAGVYFGGRGLLAYVNGVRAAPADPMVSSVALVGGLTVLWIAARTLRGASAQRPLLPQGLLLAASLLALAGAVWSIWLGLSLRRMDGEQQRTVIVFSGAGAMGLMLWWRRRRS